MYGETLKPVYHIVIVDTMRCKYAGIGKEGKKLVRK